MEQRMKYVSEPRVVTGWHYEAKCLNCNTDFHAKRITAKFCSDTCRVMYHFKKINGKLVEKKPVEKKPIEKPLYFKTKYDLREFLRKEHKFNLSEAVISKKEPKTIKINGEKWQIKRISHREHELYKG